MFFQCSNPCSWCSLLPEICISKSPSACKSEKHAIIIVQKIHTFLPTHSTKGRLNYGLQSFETCITYHFDTHEAQHHDTISNHCIDILPYRYVCIVHPYSVLVLCMFNIHPMLCKSRYRDSLTVHSLHWDVYS